MGGWGWSLALIFFFFFFLRGDQKGDSDEGSPATLHPCPFSKYAFNEGLKVEMSVLDSFFLLFSHHQIASH